MTKSEGKRKNIFVFMHLSYRENDFLIKGNKILSYLFPHDIIVHEETLTDGIVALT